MGDLKINGYTIIASIRRWEEYTVTREGDGYIRLNFFRSGQDELDASNIEEWTFEGGDYNIDDNTFKTFEECEKFVKCLPPVKAVVESSTK